MQSVQELQMQVKQRLDAVITALESSLNQQEGHQGRVTSHEKPQIAINRQPIVTNLGKYCRYITLETQELFDSLVGLYRDLFLADWHHFRRAYLGSAGGLAVETQAAELSAIYISHWFLDTYRTTKDACRSLSPLVLNEHFVGTVCPQSDEYDDLLCLINSGLRPTHITGCNADDMYIPLIRKEPQWTDPGNNFFVIGGFNYSPVRLKSIIGVMKRKKTGWTVSKLSTEKVGRPFWLLDWHTDYQVCAWFPNIGNYTAEDVTLAYVIGVACTPKLAPRDVDGWQIWPNESRPTDIQPSSYNRVDARSFFGSYEVRTIIAKTRHFTHPAQQSQLEAEQRSKESGDQGPNAGSSSGSSAFRILKSLDMFQITDWVYYARVISKVTDPVRFDVARIIIKDE